VIAKWSGRFEPLWAVLVNLHIGWCRVALGQQPAPVERPFVVSSSFKCILSHV
jgi:hypothetical protein